MIYTLGHKANYDEALKVMEAQERPLLKVGRGTHNGVPYEGGSVWETQADAQAYLDDWCDRYDAATAKTDVSLSNPHEFAVYGVIADWKADTVKAPGILPFRSLKRDAAVIALDDDDV